MSAVVADGVALTAPLGDYDAELLRNRSKARRRRILQNRDSRLSNIDPGLVKDVPLSDEDDREVSAVVRSSMSGDRSGGASLAADGAAAGDDLISTLGDSLLFGTGQQKAGRAMLEDFMRSAATNATGMHDNEASGAAAWTSLSSILGLQREAGSVLGNLGAAPWSPSTVEASTRVSGTTSTASGAAPPLSLLARNRKYIIATSGIIAVLISRFVRQVAFLVTVDGTVLDQPTRSTSFFFHLNSVVAAVFAAAQLVLELHGVLSRARSAREADLEARKRADQANPPREPTSVPPTSGEQPTRGAMNGAAAGEPSSQQSSQEGTGGESAQRVTTCGGGGGGSERLRCYPSLWRFCLAGQSPAEFALAHLVSLGLPLLLLVLSFVATRTVFLLLLSIVIAITTKHAFTTSHDRGPQQRTSGLQQSIEFLLRQMPSLGKAVIDGKRLLVEYSIYCTCNALAALVICVYYKTRDSQFSPLWAV